MAADEYLELKDDFLSMSTVQWINMHHRPKFLGDRSDRCWDWRFFDITMYKTAAVRHFGFWKFEMLTAAMLKGIKLRPRAKLHSDPSNHCWDMAISRSFPKGGGQSYWKCYVHIWTTQKEHYWWYIDHCGKLG